MKTGKNIYPLLYNHMIKRFDVDWRHDRIYCIKIGKEIGGSNFNDVVLNLGELPRFFKNTVRIIRTKRF